MVQYIMLNIITYRPTPSSHAEEILSCRLVAPELRNRRTKVVTSSCFMTNTGERTPLLLSSNAGTFTETNKCKYFGTIAGVMLVLLGLLLIRDDPSPAPNSIKHIAATSNSTSSSVFPPEFLWGAATSSYQIEGGASDGGRGPSIWDVWCLESSENCNGDTANITDDHFHHWQEDIELMKSLGLKAYRFSISWSRILPSGTAEGTESGDHRYSKTKGINYEGIQFYNRIIDALIAKGIEPFVTLYHWDLPQHLQYKYGGWENEQIIKDFAKVSCLCYIGFMILINYTPMHLHTCCIVCQNMLPILW